MAQSKHDKRVKALQRLQAESFVLLNQRSSLQSQAFGLIAPYDEEIRLAQEINRIKVRLGMAEDNQATGESVF